MRIHAELLKRIQSKLGISKRRAYERIGDLANERKLPRNLAAIALGADAGININRFASPEDLTVLRQSPPAILPVAPIKTPSEIASSGKGWAAARRRATPRRRGTSVFVVHGRNESINRAIFSFLRSIGLQPIEWNKAIAKTKKGSPYVGEILDTAFSEAVAVVVLLTPDDMARLDSRLLKPNDPPHERKLMGQPRPNVLFEAGMAFGKNPNSTVLVQVGQVRPFSDVGGRHVVHLTNSTTDRRELVTKLANAGCNVDTSGTHWITEGDFTLRKGTTVRESR